MSLVPLLDGSADSTGKNASFSQYAHCNNGKIMRYFLDLRAARLTNPNSITIPVRNFPPNATQVILPAALVVSNEGRSSPLLALVPPFLGPGLRLGARWNRLVETVNTRKKRANTGGKWARYGLRSVAGRELTKDQLAGQQPLDDQPVPRQDGPDGRDTARTTRRRPC